MTDAMVLVTLLARDIVILFAGGSAELVTTFIDLDQ